MVLRMVIYRRLIKEKDMRWAQQEARAEMEQDRMRWLGWRPRSLFEAMS